VRISLTGRVSIEADGATLDERSFPGRQGRLVFAYLLAEEGRAVPRDELAELLWRDAPPARWEKALSVLVSKLRALLEECGVDGQDALRSAFGCYQLVLPPGAWIDLAAARRAAPRTGPKPRWPRMSYVRHARLPRRPPRLRGAASCPARTASGSRRSVAS
jgi:DNA-binding SARP family transcriptional activator